MTNEEKAKEIGITIWKEWIDSGAEKGAILMAEWKDTEFREYLEKKKSDMERSIPHCNETDAKKFDERIIVITEIINELFKED